MATLSVVNADTASPEADVALLQRQLLEKEQLVAALTERLEQAAEQLDRLRRTGADRGSRRGGAGGALPLELIEDHRTAIDELKQAVTRWEEMQAGLTLGRLETQISELRDLIAGGLPAGSATGSDRRPSDGPSAQKPAGSNWWEQQKASMLGDAPPPAPPGESLADAVAVSMEGVPAIDFTAVQVPPLPPAVDFESLTLADARDAIRERDRVIAQLSEPILFAQAKALCPADAKTWEHLPDALRERFVAVEAHWQAKFRQIELDLSIERARLAREANTLRQQQDQLGKDHARLGVDRDKSRAAIPADETDPAAGTRRRWFRFLTAAGEEDDDEAEE